jgi:hypothetical protein
MIGPIQAGKWYWIQVGDEPIRALTVEPSHTGLWWHCKGPLDTEIAVPLLSFRKECEEEPEREAG